MLKDHDQNIQEFRDTFKRPNQRITGVDNDTEI